MKPAITRAFDNNEHSFHRALLTVLLRAAKLRLSAVKLCPLVFLAILHFVGCSSLQPVALDESSSLPPADGYLWKVLSSHRSDNWFHVLNDGESALDWRLRAIDSAGSSIDLQTFLWNDDKSGLAIMRHLLAAADRGVRIRLLIDDSFTAGRDQLFYDLNEHSNIRCRIYNPFKHRARSGVARMLLNIEDFSRTDHRMHNKAMIIDNRAAIIGGRNLADEYFGYHPDHNFRDMELLTAGRAVTEVSDHFDSYWNSPWSFPLEQVVSAPVGGESLAKLRDRVGPASRSTGDDLSRWIRAAESAHAGRSRLLIDEPSRHNPNDQSDQPTQLATALEAAIERAKSDVTIVSAYLVPTEAFEKTIERAEERGIQVRILTNSLRSNNHTSAHSAYRNHVSRLVHHGADLHELRALARDRRRYIAAPVQMKFLGLHAKVVVIDDDQTFIGSANLDPRSLRINTEMGLLITSESLNRQVRDYLETDFSPRNSWHLKFAPEGHLLWVADDEVRSTQPANSRLQALEDWFFSILPIESEM